MPSRSCFDVVTTAISSKPERALRLQYTTGLDDEQLDELVARVEELLPAPWNKPKGRPKKLSLRDAVAIAVAYSRQNIIQEVLGERWNVSQELVSETITDLVPLIEEATREFVPTAQEATEAVTDRACLLDGSLAPCWSYDEHDELWTRKHGTTGHNFQVITGLAGDVIFISDPVPGSVHDSVAIATTPVAEILGHSGGVIADKATRAAGTRRRARSRQEENSAPATRGKTRISRASAHRSSGRWPTSSRSNTAHRLPAAAQDLPDVVPSDDRTVLLPSEPRVLDIIFDKTH